MISRLFALVVLATLSLGAGQAQASLNVEAIEPIAERDAPEICVSFSSPLAGSSAKAAEGFVTITPKVDLTFRIDEGRLCLGGVVHGGKYGLTLRKGLGPREGERLAQDRLASVIIPDRAPMVAFRPAGYVLPANGPRQLVLRSVNVREIAIRIFRLNERALAPEYGLRPLATALTPAEVDDLASRAAETLFRGQLSVLDAPNRAVETGLGLDDTLAGAGPGVFIAIAERAGARAPGAKLAAQWFVISDLGLSALVGSDGLTLAVHALSSGQAVGGANVNVIARDNRELARAVTGPDGLVRIEAKALNGWGGAAPLLALVSNGDKDMTFLPLEGPTLDLRERGIDLGARWGDERINLAPVSRQVGLGGRLEVLVQVRDGQGRPTWTAPLTVTLLRPDGVEAQRVTLDHAANGLARADFTLSAFDAPGAWTLQARRSAKGDVLAQTTIEVADPQPADFEVEVEQPGPLKLGAPIRLNLKARHRDGLNLEGFTASGEIILSHGAASRDGFVLGVGEERAPSQRIDIPATRLDREGKARFEVTLSPSQIPKGARGWTASLRLGVEDGFGRRIERQVDADVITPTPIIGIKPGFDAASVAEGDLANFQVAVFDGAGRRIARDGLRYELTARETDLTVETREGASAWREVERLRPIALGPVIFKGEAPAVIITPALAQGRYRLTITSADGAAAAVYEFRAGRWAPPNRTEAPDRVAITLEEKVVKPGDTLHINVRPPFEGEVQVFLADDRVRQGQKVVSGPSGANLALTVPEDASGTLHVIAIAHADTGKLKGAPAARAIGAASVAVDPSARRLNVTLTAPDKPVARGEAKISLALADAAAGAQAAAFLRLRPLDSDPARSPWPGLGQALELRPAPFALSDNYDRLIDSRGVTRGNARRLGEIAVGDAVALPEAPLVPRLRLSVERAALPSDVPSLARVGQPLPLPGPASKLLGPFTIKAEASVIDLDLPEGAGSFALDVIAALPDRIGTTSAVINLAEAGPPPDLPRALAPGDVFRLADGLQASGAVELTAPNTYRALPGRIILQRQGAQTPLATLDAVERGAIKTQRDVATLTPAKRQAGAFAQDMAKAAHAQSARDLAIFAGAPFDWAGLLRSQTTPRDGDPYSLLAPIAVDLMRDDLRRVPGFPGEEASARASLAALRQVAALQRGDGTLEPIEPSAARDDRAALALTDVLLKARDRGLPVPAARVERGLALAAKFAGGADSPAPLRAYAFYLLTRVRAVDPVEVIAFADGPGRSLAPFAARAQIAAALTMAGARDRARRFFAGLDSTERDGDLPAFGALELDDGLMALALAAEHRILRADEVRPLADRLARQALAAKTFSGRERLALLLAAPALLHRGGAIHVALDGKDETENDLPLFRSERVGAPWVIENRGRASLVRIETLTQSTPNAISDGVSLQREVRQADGRPLNPTGIKRGQLIAVTLSGSCTCALVTLDEPLAGGVTLETVMPARGDGGAQTLRTRLIDHRLSAIVRPQNGRFRFTYVARARIEGTFAAPGAQAYVVEDPARMGRTRDERLTMTPP